MLYVVTWITDFAAFLVVFTVSRRLAEEDAGALFMGAIGALFAAAATLSNAFAGRLADRVGLQRVAVAGAVLLLAAVGGLVALDPHGWPYFAAYAAAGAALGMIYPPLIAWLGRGRAGRHARRAYLGFCLAFNAGVLCGQVAGGWLFEAAGAAWPLLAALVLVTVNLALLLCARDNPGDPHGRCPAYEAGRPLPDRALSATFARLCWVANGLVTTRPGLRLRHEASPAKRSRPMVATPMDIGMPFAGSVLAPPPV